MITESIIQLKGDPSAKKPVAKLAGYRYIRTYGDGRLRVECPDQLDYDGFDLYESIDDARFCYRFWRGNLKDIGHGPYWSWNFAHSVGGFASVQEATRHALRVYCGELPEVELELTEDSKRRLQQAYQILFDAASRAEKERIENAATSGDNPDTSLGAEGTLQEKSDFSTIVDELSSGATLVPAREAELYVPKREHGLYAIFVDDLSNLPQPFRKYLEKRDSLMVYVGKASDQSLYERLVSQDLHHKSPSTLFRGLGSVLGYLPVEGSLREKKNQNNYKFSAEDTSSIVAWVDTHLSVRWVTMSADDAKWYEVFVIDMFRPPLNTRHNKDAISELAVLREKSRARARV